MVIIYGLSSTNESRAELVTEICEMDKARRRGVLYAHSLRNYLLRSRMILTDVIAAVQIVGRQDGDGRVKSAAAQLRLKEKEKEGKRDWTWSKGSRATQTPHSAAGGEEEKGGAGLSPC